MSTYFVNTDAKSNDGVSLHDEWMRRGVAVTSGPRKYRDQLARLQSGDTVLMYVNTWGVVAVGRVTGARVVDAVEKVNPREEFEYHLDVDWFLDLRNEPITPAALREMVGQTPLQTVRRVVKGEVEVETAIRALMADRDIHHR